MADVGLTKEEKKKKMRKKIGTAVLFLAVNVVALTVFVLLEDKNDNIAMATETLRLLRANIGFTLTAVSMFFIIVGGDVAVFYGLGKKMHEKNCLKNSVIVSFLGRYYDRITPWAMGGEPFQMAYLIKSGMSTGDGCAVTMSRHIIRFISTAVAVVAILLGSLVSANVWVMVAAVVSIFGGLVVPCFMLLCSFKPKIGFAIGNGVIRLGSKIKIIKNPEKATEKMTENVSSFLKGIQFLSGNKSMIILIAFCALAEMFAYNSAPYFVIRAIGITDLSYWHVFVLCLYVNYASSFAPTPGGTGLAELSFYAIFASYIGEGYLFWAVLFWRTAVFYIPVAIGFLLQTVLSVSDMVSARKEFKRASDE